MTKSALHSMATANSNKTKELATKNTTACTNLRGPESVSIETPLSDQNLLVKVPVNVSVVKWDLLH